MFYKESQSLEEMPAITRRCRRRKIQKGGGDFDSFCPFCHFPLEVPTGVIMDSFEDEDKIEQIRHKARWMSRNLVVDFDRTGIYRMGAVSNGIGTVIRPTEEGITETVDYIILNNFRNDEENEINDAMPKGYGFHLACFRELDKLFEAAGWNIREDFFKSFYPVEFKECLESLGDKQFFGDGHDAPIDITNENHYNPPSTNPVFKEIFLSCGTLRLISKIPEKERRYRVVEARQAQRALAPLDLPSNVMSRIGGMFLKKDNMPAGGAGNTRRMTRKIRRRRIF